MILFIKALQNKACFMPLVKVHRTLKFLKSNTKIRIWLDANKSTRKIEY